MVPVITLVGKCESSDYVMTIPKNTVASDEKKMNHWTSRWQYSRKSISSLSSNTLHFSFMVKIPHVLAANIKMN